MSDTALDTKLEEIALKLADDLQTENAKNEDGEKLSLEKRTDVFKTIADYSLKLRKVGPPHEGGSALSNYRRNIAEN